jgi:ketosteroid isomerase-like protein
VTDSANLDLVRSIYADWERGDFSRTNWADPRIEFALLGGPDPGQWTGISEMGHAWRTWLASWSAYRLEAEEFRELGGGRVLVLVRGFARGKTSGVEVENLNANVLTISDGKVTRLASYSDRDRALADLGLEGQGMPEKPMTLPPNLDEIQRKFIEAANRGDIDAAFGTPPYRPDAVWDDSAIEGGIYEGLAAIREHGEEWFGSFENVEVVREEFCDLGNGVVLAVLLQKGRPLGSIGYVQLRWAGISIWSDGLIERLTTYTDIDEARAAAERLAQERG